MLFEQNWIGQKQIDEFFIYDNNIDTLKEKIENCISLYESKNLNNWNDEIKRKKKEFSEF